MGTASSLLRSRTHNEHSPAHGSTSDRVSADPERSPAGGRKVSPATKLPSAETPDRVGTIEISTVDPDPPFRALPVPDRPRPRSRRPKSAGWIRAGAPPEEMEEVKRQAHLEGWNLIGEAKHFLSLHDDVITQQCLARARSAFSRAGVIPLEAEAAARAVETCIQKGIDQHEAHTVPDDVPGDALVAMAMVMRPPSGAESESVDHMQSVQFSLPHHPHTAQAAARNANANVPETHEVRALAIPMHEGDVESSGSGHNTSQAPHTFISQRPHSAHPRYSHTHTSPHKSKRNRARSAHTGTPPSSSLAHTGAPPPLRVDSPALTSTPTRAQRPATAWPGSWAQQASNEAWLLRWPASRDALRPSSALPQTGQRRFSMLHPPPIRQISSSLLRSASARAFARVTARDLSSTNDQYIVSTPSSRPSTPYIRTPSSFGAILGGANTGTPTHVGVRTPTHVGMRRPSTAHIGAQRPSTPTHVGAQRPSTPTHVGAQRPRTASRRPSTASISTNTLSVLHSPVSPFSPWMLQKFGTATTTSPTSSPHLGREAHMGRVASLPSLLSGGIRPFSAMALRRLSVVVGSKPGGEILTLHRSQHHSDVRTTSRPHTASRRASVPGRGSASRDGNAQDGENVQNHVQHDNVRRASVQSQQLGRFLGGLEEQFRDLDGDDDDAERDDQGPIGGDKRKQVPRPKSLVVPKEGPSPDRVHVAHRVCVRIPEGVIPGEVISERYSNGDVFSYVVPDLDATFEHPDEPESAFATVIPVGYEVPEDALSRMSEDNRGVEHKPFELSTRKLIPDYVPPPVKGGVRNAMQVALREETPEDFVPDVAAASARGWRTGKSAKYLDGPNIGQKFRRRSVLEIDKQMLALKSLSEKERQELGIEELEVQLEEEKRREKELADAEEIKRRRMDGSLDDAQLEEIKRSTFDGSVGLSRTFDGSVVSF